MDSVRSSDLPADLARSLPLGRRILLVSEILMCYCRVRLRLLREQFPIALAQVRGTTREPAWRSSESPAWRSPESAVTYLRAARLARAVQRTLRLLPADARCLMQSLVLTGLLARRGIDTTLLIGVNPGDEFEAHAWVEYAGHALLPDAQGVYQVLAEL